MKGLRLDVARPTYKLDRFCDQIDLIYEGITTTKFNTVIFVGLIAETKLT